MDQSLASLSSTRQPPRPVPGLLVIFLTAVTGAAAALSIDVVEATRGAGGDETTYVAMALSAAHDGDLEYESADLNRFYSIYARPPEGILLARGERAPGGEVPLVFAKGALHAIVAAPFVWLFDLNGLLLLNVVLLTGICSAGYAFLAARCRPQVAIAFTLAFVGASITPIYAARLTPDLLEFALVFLAYFLWLYKEVAERGDGPSRWLFGAGADAAAVLLLALAAFSKPSILVLACPIVALSCLRRRFAHAALTGAMLVLLAAGAFRFDALVTGDFSYGRAEDRRRFHTASTGHPFLHDGRFDRGMPAPADTLRLDGPWDTGDALVFARNTGYLLVGRHFGIVPYFFPAAVIIACALRRWRSAAAWQVLVAAVAAGATTLLLVLLPHSWSGGSLPGNHYFLTIYPALFFLAPPMATWRPAACAWLGGTLFVAHALINPFVPARETYSYSQQGVLRFLPVELTLAGHLPTNAGEPRRGIPYGEDPTVFLHFLDDRATLAESATLEVAGSATAEMVVRTNVPLEAFELRLQSHVRNTVEVAAGGPAERAELEAGRPATLRVAARGVYARPAWSYLLSFRTRADVVPWPASVDPVEARRGVEVGVTAVVDRAE